MVFLPLSLSLSFSPGLSLSFLMGSASGFFSRSTSNLPSDMIRLCRVGSHWVGTSLSNDGHVTLRLDVAHVPRKILLSAEPRPIPRTPPTNRLPEKTKNTATTTTTTTNSTRTSSNTNDNSRLV